MKKKGKEKVLPVQLFLSSGSWTGTFISVCYWCIVHLVPPRFSLLLLWQHFPFSASSLLPSLLCSYRWWAEERECGVLQSLPGDGMGEGGCLQRFVTSEREMYLCVKKNTLDAVKTLFTSKPVTVLKNLWSWCVQLNFPTQHVHLTKPIISQLEVWFLRTIEHSTFQGAAITETIVLNNFGLMVCEHHPSQLPLSYFGWNLTVHRVMLGIL